MLAAEAQLEAKRKEAEKALTAAQTPKPPPPAPKEAAVPKTAEEIQARIDALLAEVETLSKRLEALQGSEDTEPPPKAAGKGDGQPPAAGGGR